MQSASVTCTYHLHNLGSEYEAMRQPTAAERALRFLGRVPRLVSRPDALVAACLGQRPCDDADSSNLSEGVAGLLPLATRRSIELAQGRGGGGGALVVREEPHATDDIEAAAETIEHAKAKVRWVCSIGIESPQQPRLGGRCSGRQLQLLCSRMQVDPA